MAFPKAPLELYGYKTIPRHSQAVTRGVTEECPFLGRKCWKTRKSEPDQSIGTCIVGSGGEPQVICPTRLVPDERVFHDTRHLLTDPGSRQYAVPEVGMPEFGNVDFVVIGTEHGEIVDFYGLELQTIDTTGSVWEGRQDFYAGTMGDGYKYGMNWKMTAKLVLVQTAHKAPVFESWGKKFVWVMQDTLLRYMQGAFNFSGFHAERPDDPVLFYGYHFGGPDDDRFTMELSERIGGDLEAVERAMGAGSPIGEELRDATLDVIQKKRARWREL